MIALLSVTINDYLGFAITEKSIISVRKRYTADSLIDSMVKSYFKTAPGINVL